MPPAAGTSNQVGQHAGTVGQHGKNLYTTSINDFISRLHDNGILVKTGRGIFFIDDKKTRMKGSAINYPLSKITAIIEKNLEAEKRQLQKTEMQEQKKQQQIKLQQQQKQKPTEFIEVRRGYRRGM